MRSVPLDFGYYRKVSKEGKGKMKGDTTVLSNLKTSADLESHLIEQYRVDKIAVKASGYSKLYKLFCGFYEDSEYFLKSLVKRVIYFDVNPSFNAGEVTGPDDLGELLKASLEFESAVVDQYQGFCAQAWDVKDDNTRNMYEHLIKWHEKHIAKLEKEIGHYEDFGDAAYKESVL